MNDWYLVVQTEGRGLRGRWVMNRKVIKRYPKRVYIHFYLSPPPPLLKPRFHNGGGELPFFFPSPCAEMMRSTFTMAMISFQSHLSILKCRRKAKIGRPRSPEERRPDSKWKDWLLGNASIRPKDCVSEERSQEKCGNWDRSFIGRKSFFGSASSSKALFERDNCRHCMHAYTYSTSCFREFCIGSSHSYQNGILKGAGSIQKTCVCA